MIRRAFTMVEVLAALGLLAMLVGLMSSTMTTMSHRSAWVREHAARQIGASTAIDRLATALRTTMVEDPDGGAGVRGDAHALTVLSRTEAIRPGETPSDLAALEVRGDRTGGALTASWKSPSDARDDSSETHTLAGTAVVRFRYHDGQAWRDAFDSREAARLPGAVEISLWFVAPDGPGQSDGADRTEDAAVEDEYPARAPDRVRVIAVPDPAGEEAS